MRIRLILLTCVVAAGLAAGGTMSEVRAGEPISAEQMKLARYVLTGFRDSRSQLRTGVFRISGTRIAKNRHRRIDHVGEIEGFAAFDFERNWFRFEREEPSYSGDPRGGRYIKKDDMVISRRLKTSETSILKPTSEPTDAIGMFDVRTACVANDLEFERNVGLDKLLDEFLPESNLVETVKENHLYCVSWKTARDALKRSVWFDEKSGFCPVRMETRYRATPDLPPVTTCHATYLERNGAWVPETLSMAYSPRPEEEKHVTYAFDWKSVNETLDDEMFAVEALQKPGEKVRVIDYRLDKPIVVYDPAFPPSQVQSRWTVGRVLLVALSTVGLLVGIAWLCFLANRRRSR